MLAEAEKLNLISEIGEDVSEEVATDLVEEQFWLCVKI
jgi:hypothetical protein